MRIILGSKNYSSWSLRAWLALEQTGAPFDEVVIPLDQPDTAAQLARHSPSGRVPVLVDGAVTVWDSLAITEYLAEKFPGAGLWPSDPGERATARAVCAEMHAGFQALRGAMPFNARRSSPNVVRDAAVESDIRRVVALWSRARGPYLFGPRSAADAFYAPVVCRFDTYGVPLDGAAASYAAAVRALPSLREWMDAGRAEPWSSPKYDL